MFGDSVLDGFEHVADLSEEQNEMPVVLRRAENRVRLEVLFDSLLNVTGARHGEMREAQVRGDQIDLVGDDDDRHVDGWLLVVVVDHVGEAVDLLLRVLLVAVVQSHAHDLAIELFDVAERLLAVDVEDEQEEMRATEAVHANPLLLRIGGVRFVEARRVDDADVKETLAVEQRSEMVRGETRSHVRRRVVVGEPLTNDGGLADRSVTENGHLNRLITHASAELPATSEISISSSCF